MFTNGSPHSSHRNHRPLSSEIDEEDHKSTTSQDSGVPRTEGALHSLQLVAGNRVRHGRCAPEFLEEMATKGAYDSFRRSLPQKLKVIAGQEGRQFFRNFVSEHSKRLNDKVTKSLMPSPIAFAVTAWEGNTKYVDYYMTWRGLKHSHMGKELEQRVELLDSEFRRLVKKLDEEYKRINALKSHENLSPLKHEFPSRSSSHSSKKPPPAAINLSTNAEDGSKEDYLAPSLPEPPASAADSVMSLPLLNMVRNVPLSHRVPLRIANPDRLSMLSETVPSIEVLPTTPVKSVSRPHTPLAEKGTNTLTIPDVRRLSKHSHDFDVKKFLSSTKSDSNSSRSSRLSRSSSLSQSENRSLSLDRHRHHESGGEKRHYTDDDLPEFLLVFLGDKLETDTTSWHGLERQTSVRSLPADRHSPWIGPLARSGSNGHRYSLAESLPYTPSETGSDDSGFADSWSTSTPVVPIKSLMESGGHAHPYYHPPPVVPGAHYISVGQMGSPGPGQSPYLYSTPHMDAASPVPYIPWQLQTPPVVPSSRPPSRAYSAVSRGSPYLQAHMGF